MKYLFFALALGLAFPILAEEGVTLTVTVTNIPGAQGDLLIGLYDSAESFTDAPFSQSPKVPLTSKNDVSVTIKNLKPGRYAVSVIQDLNQNGVLDKNFVGMPKEPLAFSVIDKIPKGKPKFEACSFEVVDSDLAMTIRLVVK